LWLIASGRYNYQVPAHGSAISNAPAAFSTQNDSNFAGQGTSAALAVAIAQFLVAQGCAL
jgi:hypothetical protein